MENDMRLKIELNFRWFDIWIGVYIDTKNRAIYVCLIPMIVLSIRIADKLTDKIRDIVAERGFVQRDNSIVCMKCSKEFYDNFLEMSYNHRYNGWCSLKQSIYNN